MNNYNIILAGNPNVGKSTIFNLLTGYRQHTGNWAGKTVDNASGEYTYNKNKYVIYDLPGMYSLVPHSKEEVIARDMVCNNNDIDCIVVVCNAVSLKRGLNLVLQILEVNSNVLLVVNLMDEAKKRGIEIDLRKLSSILGINVVGTSATYNDGIDKLVDGIEYVCKNKNNSSYSLTYDNDIEDNINNIYKYIGDVDKKRWISIRLLCRDIDIYDKYKNKVLDNYLNRVGNIEDRICSCIINRCHDIYKMCVINRYNKYLNRDKKLDKIITSKFWGIIIMILSLFLLFWLTIVGSNYPSILLSRFLFGIEDNLYNILSFLPNMIRNILVHGVYKTTAWVVSVMLPPMMIFFPLFTILEDMGFLPRIAFNMDNMFSKCDACGKQCLTMCMGIGCNAVGVTGTRIIDNKKERIIAILTNSFMPCNGRYPVIIAVISMFIINYSRGVISSLLISLVLVFVILFSVAITFVVSKILSRLLFKKDKTSFILELPDYRKIRIGHVIVSSLLDRTLFVLGRAVMVAAPCGLVLYLFTNISINGSNIITFLSDKLDLFGCLLGLDGVILLSFLLGLPANEIVLPIILMIYLNTGILTDYDSLVSLKNILISNGWTIITAINFIIFSIFHFPCGTTLLTIKKETNSYFYTFIAFIIPLFIGIILCLIINFLYNCFI
ncbi:MAG: ferrous iron transport protein B [Bacilli bacterium]|nr:ferrous iron transport protein B [Bacilli bacterium]